MLSAAAPDVATEPDVVIVDDVIITRDSVNDVEPVGDTEAEFIDVDAEGQSQTVADSDKLRNEQLSCPTLVDCWLKAKQKKRWILHQQWTAFSP